MELCAAKRLSMTKSPTTHRAPCVIWSVAIARNPVQRKDLVVLRDPRHRSGDIELMRRIESSTTTDQQRSRTADENLNDRDMTPSSLFHRHSQ
jgi:hypothetical protein